MTAVFGNLYCDNNCSTILRMKMNASRVMVQRLVHVLVLSSCVQLGQGLPRIALITSDTVDLSAWRGVLNVDLVTFSKGNVSSFDVIEVAEKALGSTRGEKPTYAVIGSGINAIDGFIAEVAERFTVPMISITKSSYEHYNQKNFQVNMRPSPADRDHVILQLAQELGCHHIALFTSHEKLPTLSHALQSIPKRHDTIGFRTVRLPFNETPLAIVKMTDQLYLMSNHSSALIVLDCTDQEASLLIKAAHVMSVRTMQHRWLVLRDDVHLTGRAENLPAGVLGIRSWFNEKGFVEDALTLLNRSIQLWKSNETVKLGNMSSSLSPAHELYRIILAQQFKGETGWIKFDEQGDRVSASYDIVKTSMAKNASGQKVWKTVGSAQGVHINLHNTFWTEKANHSYTLLRMVVIEEDPMLIVTGYRYDRKCILSYPCTQYIPVANNSAPTGAIFRPIKTCCIGFLIDVLRWLERDLPIKAELHLVKDGNFGSYNRTANKWNGVIAELLSNQADIGLTTMTITNIRAQFVDFSYPILYGQTKLVISNNGITTQDTVEFGFLAPFHILLWFGVLTSIAVITWIVWALERLSPNGHYRMRRNRNARNIFDISACMSYIWSNLVKLELESVKPRSSSARLTTAICSFVTLIIVTSYTANLTAYLFSIDDQLPVSGIDDPKFQDPPQGFTFATLRSSSTLALFTDSTDPAYRKIGKNMQPYLVTNYSEGLRKLRNGELKAFVYDSPFIDLGVSKISGCHFRVVGNPIKTKAFGFAFPKNSVWKEPVSNMLLRYESKDYFRTLTERWFRGGCLQANGPTHSAYRMEPGNFSGLFVIAVGATGMCFLILLVEYLWFCRVKRIGTYYATHENT